MLEFKTEQKSVEIGNVKLGGQPGEYPTVMIGTVFYAKHKALLNEKTGEFDKKMLEQELNDYTEVIEDTGMQGIIDVVGGYPEALAKQCEYISDTVEYPFLVDGLNDTARIPAIEILSEKGLLKKAILNSIDDATSEENLLKLKDIGLNNAVLLTFSSRHMFPKQKLEFLKNELIPKANKANIKNIIVDTAVLDLASMGINVETVQLVKEELGLPAGFAPANAIYGWNYVKKFGDIPRCGAIASQMAYCVNAGSDFVLFGPIKFAKCVVPSISLINAINSYYRKRILRKLISEKTPLKHIF